MAVRSAAMSHIELPTMILGRCDHVLLLYRVHTFREVVPENLLFSSPFAHTFFYYLESERDELYSIDSRLVG